MMPFIGGAQFVAHVGEEGALGATGGFGGDLGGDQFGGAVLHQDFQVLAMGVEFDFVKLALGDVDPVSDQLSRFPGSRIHHSQTVMHPAVAAIRHLEAVFMLVHAMREQRPQTVENALAVIGMDMVGPEIRGTDEFLGFGSHQFPDVPADEGGGIWGLGLTCVDHHRALFDRE